jgi:hypothetical protein
VDEPTPPPRDPGRVVAAAYGLAVVCLFVPLALVGALFAGVALARRNRPAEGAGVVVVGIACTALGVTLLR